jgi:hypothetical protein
MSDFVPAHEPPPPSSESLDAMTRDRRARSRRLLIGGVAIVAVVGGGLFGIFRYQDAQLSARLSGSWGAFSQCLLGAEVDPGEGAGHRFRALQLSAMTLPEAQRAPADGVPWPQRCAPLGHAVHEALREAGRADGDAKDLAQWTEALGKQLKEPDAFAGDLSAAVDNAWAAARTAKVTRGAATQVAGPPQAAQPLDADALAKATPLSKASFAPKLAHTEPHAGGALRILVEEKAVPNAPFVCTFTRDSARCQKLAAAMADGAHGLRLLGTADDDAAPLVFAGNRGDGGVYRADTAELVHRGYSYGGWSNADGRSAVLGWNESTRDLILTRKVKDGAPRTDKLDHDFEVGNYFYSSQILWDQVMLRGVTRDDARRLFARQLSPTGLAEPVDVGALEEAGLVQGGADEPPHITGCRSGADIAVRVKGWRNDFLAFHTGGRWSQPVSPELTGGTLSCRKGEATITRVEPAGGDAAWKSTVTQVRCTTAGCTRNTARFEQILGNMFQFAPRDGQLDAVELDGKLLVVWAAGERGGVRMRFASADRIASAPDTVLYDDLTKDGKVDKLSTLFGLRLLARNGFAILLLGTVSGVHALRIGADGKVGLAPIEWP